ncbi:CbiX/SirB N-terminal domain-containing protein [Synechococcus sp. CS-1332]|uniref:CbiX/SirB N-terminal domain-containing protein n=1 Tax=Synechococcus sp. CS-1332 TaxID=2847972 RepID=UPI00223C344F|nr:CbiX/SirB N-terminal domain-containing protein [Synechococcus sp. CS-1332]MCT0207220.1 DNA mismatch repair protein MutS [Synechococcus sp. CS-1332]
MARILASPLLLVVHGRAGGVIPAELLDLAHELEVERGAPVRLEALTAAEPPALPAGSALAPLLLVPLFLLPGSHVRRDVPQIAARCRRRGPLRRLPFLGSWPSWQGALADELASLKAQGGGPWLLHHPLEGPLGAAFLAHLEAVTGGRCRATPYSAPNAEDAPLPLPGPALPLALAANRLTDALPSPLGVPLLQRPRFRAVLLEALMALP